MTDQEIPPNILKMSPNLLLNEQVARRTAAGESIVHLGFGEARLPVVDSLVRVLRANAPRNAYGPVAGDIEAREAAAGYFVRRGIPTDAGQIILGPGTKPLLMAVNLAVRGDVILPEPCWNSYGPQATLAGKRILSVPIPADCGGVPETSALQEAISVGRAAGMDPRIMVLTVPDNPTGTVAAPARLQELCTIAREEDLLVISDEIYRDLVHDPAASFLSPAELAPERTVVMTGLSKSLALAGWRIGVARVPASPYGEWLKAGLLAIASDVWSTVVGPIQAAAAYAFAEPDDIHHRMHASARLHGQVARALHRAAISAGMICRAPTAAFYIYPDLEPLRPQLARLGIVDSASLQRWLLERFGLAVLAGHQLGDRPHSLRFKAATSMLYGETRDLQELALAAKEPLRLTHIEKVVTRVEQCFTDLCQARQY